MLRPAARPPGEAELISHVRKWLNLLAAGRLDDACAELDEPNSYGTRWTPESITRTVAQTFAEGTRFRREHPEGPQFSRVEAVAGSGRPDVVELADGSGYSVEHSVPLNGSYSDLTSQTEFRWRGDMLAFVLHDLHVL